MECEGCQTQTAGHLSINKGTKPFLPLPTRTKTPKQYSIQCRHPLQILPQTTQRQ